MRAVIALLGLSACLGQNVEIPEIAPEYVPPTYRSIDDLPRPHSMPAPEVVDASWQPVDIGTVEALRVAACNPGLVSIFRALSSRDAMIAGQVRRATLGCLRSEKWADARSLADVLIREGSDPVDFYIVAKAVLQQQQADGNACISEAYTHIVLENVLLAADPIVSARLLADEAFESVHTAYRFRLATMPGADRQAERLAGSVWYGPGVGMYGTLSELHLHGAGVVTRRTYAVDDAGVRTSTDVGGTWQFAEGSVRVEVDGQTVVYALDEGAVTLDTGDSDGIADYFDAPSECDA